MAVLPFLWGLLLHFYLLGVNSRIVMHALLTRFPPHTQQGSTALGRCAEKGYLGCLRALLKAGANPNLCSLDGFTPLMSASLIGHIECVEALLEHGANMTMNKQNELGSTALHLAASRSHSSVVKLLLDAGVNRDLQTRKGLTALNLSKDPSCKSLLETYRVFPPPRK